MQSTRRRTCTVHSAHATARVLCTQCTRTAPHMCMCLCLCMCMFQSSAQARLLAVAPPSDEAKVAAEPLVRLVRVGLTRLVQPTRLEHLVCTGEGGRSCIHPLAPLRRDTRCAAPRDAPRKRAVCHATRRTLGSVCIDVTLVRRWYTPPRASPAASSPPIMGRSASSHMTWLVCDSGHMVHLSAVGWARLQQGPAWAHWVCGLRCGWGARRGAPPVLCRHHREGFLVRVVRVGQNLEGAGAR